ncbi:MAG: nuclear transport factor 2 family protein [Acidobacteriia bacterium]|nr:nuclear transport factor 2 family protein [Terriglobia bacterium]
MAAALPAPVQGYFDAVHASQPDALAACFAEDAEVHFPMQELVVGRGKIREFYAGVFVFYARRHDEITAVYQSANGDVATEIHFDGTTGDGKDVTFDAVDVFTVRNNKIQKLRIFYDSAKVLQMLGALPSASR